MKKEISFLLVAFLVISSSLIGQDKKDWRLYEKDSQVRTEAPSNRNSTKTPVKPSNQFSTGKIQYHQDARISKLDSLKKTHPTLPNGYRLQIFFGDRETAREKRAEFLREFPEVGAHISYLAPNFRLRIGDFRSRLECEKFKAEIGNKYPGSFIVKDKIELPDLEK